MKYLSWLRLFILIASLYSPLHAQHGDKIRKISWRCRGGPGLMALARPLFGKSRRWNNPAARRGVASENRYRARKFLRISPSVRAWIFGAVRRNFAVSSHTLHCFGNNGPRLFMLLP